MERLKIDFDPFANDEGRWGASLANNAEIMLPCLEAAGVTSVAEVGAYAGDLTGLLADWAALSGGQVLAIDPDPEEGLVKLAAEREHVELIRETSLEALGRISLPDAVVIDGDHNYYTVSNELAIVAEASGAERLPLLLFHDVCWPHARRDDYFDPELIPAEHRQPYVDGAHIFPGEPGLTPGALPFRHAARQEGGPRNGVLTAIEDFVAERPELRLAVVPAFFGLGVVWDTGAPWADAVAEILAPWDRNPHLERLEGNRVFHLASAHRWRVHAVVSHERDRHKSEFLQRLLDSRMFSLAVTLTRLRERGEPAFSKEEIRRLLAE